MTFPTISAVKMLVKLLIFGSNRDLIFGSKQFLSIPFMSIMDKDCLNGQMTYNPLIYFH